LALFFQTGFINVHKNAKWCSSFFFSRKEAKAVVPLRGSTGKLWTIDYVIFEVEFTKVHKDLNGVAAFFFPRKEAKAVVPLRGSIGSSLRILGSVFPG
jgi:hypothetical protein